MAAVVDVSSSRCPGHVVVALRGELDVADATWLARALPRAAAPGSRIIVDLAGLTFMDCGSLSALVSARKQALQAGGDLLLAAPRGTVLRLLSLTDLDGALSVFASVGEAANGARRSPAPARLAAERADGAAPPGNAAVDPVGSGVSAAGSQ